MVRLPLKKDSSQVPSFYSISPEKGGPGPCRSSADFFTISPKATLHQLFLCQDSGDLIVFVPSLKHQTSVFSEKKNKYLQDKLVAFLPKKPKIKNTEAKQRKGKLSEIINYKLINWQIRKAFKKRVKLMVLAEVGGGVVQGSNLLSGHLKLTF